MSFLSLMEIFYNVALQNSFTKAAKELDLSKSYISMQISELETQLGTKLLNRTTRHLSLTQAGDAFLESCKKIIAEKDHAVSTIESIKSEPAGHLKISAPPSMCASYLSTLLPKFVAAHPKIKVELEASASVKDLLASKIDIAIRTTRKPDPNYIARLLGDFALTVCATPHYLEQNGTPKKPQDLIHHNCLIYSSDPTGHIWEFQSEKKREEIPVKGNLLSDNSFAVQNAMLANMGIARLPSYLLHSERKSAKLIPLLEDFNQNRLPIYALYAPQAPAKTKAFIAFIKDYFAIHKI
jgi:LysR family transcriptional regulator for bpeEF and oprC